MKKFETPFMNVGLAQNEKFESQNKIISLTKEFVWNHEGFVLLEVSRIWSTRLIFGVVIGLAAAQVPAPGVLIVAY